MYLCQTVHQSHFQQKGTLSSQDADLSLRSVITTSAYQTGAIGCGRSIASCISSACCVTSIKKHCAEEDACFTAAAAIEVCASAARPLLQPVLYKYLDLSGTVPVNHGTCNCN